MERELFHKYLHGAVSLRASDIHFKVGSPPLYRVQKLLRAVRGEPLQAADTDDIARLILEQNPAVATPETITDMDTSFHLAGVSRFRVSLFRQKGTLSLVLRMIPQSIPSFEDLLLPPQAVDLANYNRGLVLVTGATGSGKSSTLAAIIHHINQTRQAHVITIEDPIEFVHKDNRCAVSQREVGSDTTDFNRAFRAALRQDPDVILVGEMRDLETIDIALKASETGHMVYSTVHTTDATKTVGRLISVFPPQEQQTVRIRLAENLRATMSQRLLPRADGCGMVVAYELMKVTGSIEEAIKNQDETSNLKDLIEKGREQYGMISFDQCLTDLYRGELITLEVARKGATNPGDFERALHYD